MIENLQAHYGFTRSPFSKALAPQMLHRHNAHSEAVARIGWCLSERALGVITGEDGAGKTVAVRAALAGLDASRTTIVYLGNPAVGTRGLYAGIVLALGGTPRYQKSMLIPQTADLLAAEEHERGRNVVVVLDEAHLLGVDQLEELRLLTNAELDSHSPFACLLVGQPTATQDQARDLRRPRPTDRPALRDERDGSRRDQDLPLPPPQARRPQRPALQ